jgi:hypothetical protein
MERHHFGLMSSDKIMSFFSFPLYLTFLFSALFFFSFSMKDVLVDPLSLRSFLNFVPFLNQLERNEETQKTLGLNTNEKLERQDKKSLENA